MTVKKKRKKKNVLYTKLFSIALMVVAIVIFVNVGKNVYTMFTLQKQEQLVKEELEILKEEHASLVSIRDKLEDPNYVQTYARGEYMFSKGDEKVFYLPGAEEEK